MNLKAHQIPVFVLILLFITTVSPLKANSDPLLSDPYPPELQTLIDFIKEKGFDLTVYLDDPRFELYGDISDRFRRAAERRFDNVDEYKTVLRFDDKSTRISDFIAENLDAMVEAEETYDIPRYLIAAIIGIESNFGRVTGSYNPLNVYVSMYSEGYRTNFSRAQLEELLIFTRDNNLDVFELNSSYAGAMAYAQFIPYSLNRWFVGDDITDMRNNILSVANYLAHFKNVTGSLDKAVFRYNPSSLYTDTVLDLAKKAEALGNDK
jgi:membrane-bound lytic murein transglycosylase B